MRALYFEYDGNKNEVDTKYHTKEHTPKIAIYTSWYTVREDKTPRTSDKARFQR